MEGEYERPYHVIQAGAEATTSNYGGGGLGRIEVKLASGAGCLEELRFAAGGAVLETERNQPVIIDKRRRVLHLGPMLKKRRRMRGSPYSMWAHDAHGVFGCSGNIQVRIGQAFL
jgi:hypothetical protein